MSVCETCDEIEGQEEHECPYSSAQGSDTTCNCCEECEEKCREEI